MNGPYKKVWWKDKWFWFLLLTSPIWLLGPLLVLAYLGGL